MTNVRDDNWHPSIGSWGVVADGEWHYTCFNLWQAVRYSTGPLSTMDLTTVEDIDIWTSTALRGKYGENKLWIDEFSISAVDRRLLKSAPPLLGGRAMKVVSVQRTNHADGGTTWRASFAYEGCLVDPVPATFALNTSGIDGPLSPSTRLTTVVTQQHTSRVNAALLLSFNGTVTEVSLYASAQDVQDALRPLIGNNTVRQTGSCISGHGWLVTFNSLHGDQPALSASIMPISTQQPATGTASSDISNGGGATVRVETVEDGGLIMGPIPADYMYLPGQNITNTTSPSTVRVTVNEGAARCAPGVCEFSFDEKLSPTVSGAQVLWQHVSLTSLLITGSGFHSTVPASASQSDSSGLQVSVGTVPCHVVGPVSADALSCNITACLPAGQHMATVNVAGRGVARESAVFSVPVLFESVTPSELKIGVASLITIRGSGFDALNATANVVFIEEVPCEVATASCEEVTCVITLPESSGRRLFSRFTLSIGGQTDSTTTATGIISAMPPPEPPIVTNISPTFGPAGGGTVLTITGAGFAQMTTDSVRIGDVSCSIIANSASQAVCATRPSSIGTFFVTVKVGDAVSTPSPSARFQYMLSVASVSPQTVGLGGGVPMQLTGVGLCSGGAPMSARVATYGREVYVVGLYAPQLVRETQDISFIGTVRNEIQRVALWYNNTAQANNDGFGLSGWGASTRFLPRNVNSFELQDALSAIVPTGASVRVTRVASPLSTSEQSLMLWNVEFRGNLGDIPSEFLSLVHPS